MTVLLGDDDGVRREWASLLGAELRRQRLTAKDLREKLAEPPLSCHVKRQTVEGWLTGRWAPRPTHQAAICAVLRVPHTSVFPVSVFVEGRK